jgi:hypothetical protein
MTKRDSTKVMWRVQVRKSRQHKWTSKGLYETRESARDAAGTYRMFGTRQSEAWIPRYGFGNTRVLKYIRGEKK